MPLSALLATLLTVSVAHATRMKVAITVDDLPSHSETIASESRAKIARRFVETLKRHDIIEAYGFVNAGKVEEAPRSIEVLKIWHEAGHPLANHTYSHLRLDSTDAEKFLDDLKRNEAMLAKFGHPESYKWFRYPFLYEGDTPEKRERIRQALAESGYRIAQVSVDFEDWAWNDPYTRCRKQNDRKSIKWLEDSYIEFALHRLEYSRVLSEKLYGRQIGHVLLMHVGVFDSLMLDRLLRAYKNAGVEFVRLAEAASDPAYAENPGVTKTPGGDFMDQIAVSRGVTLPSTPKLPLRKLKDLCRS